MTTRFSLTTHRAARTRGFTLIEVMVTVAIIGILSAIALPSYRQYILRGQLVDATNALASMRGNMERYFQDNRTYAQVGSGSTAVNPPCASTDATTRTFGSFVVTCTVAATTFTLTASGSAATSGFAYTVNQLDQRATTAVPANSGYNTSTTCWTLKRGKRVEARQRGVTIIELVTAIALIGVLLKLAVPAFSAWVRNAQVRTVTDSLQSGIRLAQAEAVRRNRTVVFSLTNAQPGLNSTAVANGMNWAVQTIAQFGDSTTDLFVQGGALTEVASGVSITGPVAVCFNSNGRLVAVTAANTGVPSAVCSVSDARFDVSAPNADRALAVTVGLAGQVRLCDPKRPARSDTSPDGCPA